MRVKKVLRDYVKYNTEALLSSDMDLRAVYEIMFRDNGLIMCETCEGYRIRKWPYSEIRTLIDRASALMYSRLGATGGYVALEMDNSVEWIVAYWSILKSGNKPYLVNCRHPKSLSEAILKTLGITKIVGLKSTELTGEFIDFEEVFKASFKETDLVCPDDVFENEFCLSTSATSLHETVCFYTGSEISKQILDATEIIRESPRMASMYNGSIKQLAFLPFYHIFGLFAVYYWFAFFGRTFVFLKDYSPDTIARTCRRHEVTHIFAVPLLWHTVEEKIQKGVRMMPESKQKTFRRGLKICTALQNIFPYWGSKAAKRIMGEVTEQVFGPSVQFCISGGSYIKDSCLELFNGIGYPLHNGYGMSEVGITSVELRSRPKYRNMNSVGHSLESIEYKISDEGTLMIKGTSVSSKIMIDGVIQPKEEWFDTKDVAALRDGYCFISGRAKDVVIGANGENINPDVIEQMIVLKEHVNFSCFGKPGDNGDEVLSVVVQLGNDITEEMTRSIYSEIRSINDTLPSGFKIREFYFTNDPIMSPTAIKVSRQFLLRGISAGDIRLIPMSGYVPDKRSVDAECDPEILSEVTDIIADVLECSKNDIRPDSDIMLDLNATSLQFFAIIAEINKRYQVETYSCNTPQALGKYIEEQKN